MWKLHSVSVIIPMVTPWKIIFLLVRSFNERKNPTNNRKLTFNHSVYRKERSQFCFFFVLFFYFIFVKIHLIRRREYFTLWMAMDSCIYGSFVHVIPTIANETKQKKKKQKKKNKRKRNCRFFVLSELHLAAPSLNEHFYFAAKCSFTNKQKKKPKRKKKTEQTNYYYRLPESRCFISFGLFFFFIF